MASFRTEKDSMGEMQVPESAYYGAQTQRAVENFPISDLRFRRPFIKALGIIKWAAAQANRELELVEPRLADAIIQAAEEVIDGNHDDQYVVDIFQTGSGTSSNMNTNEVIANRAIEILGGVIGSKDPVHPNDHVNRGQSSNDVIPTAIHIAAMLEIKEKLIPSLAKLYESLDSKAHEFDDIVKIGRTHLQDATPITLGQEFSGYARQAELSIRRVECTLERLSELALGGTAVGTGINAHPKFAERAIELIGEKTGIAFREATNHFEAQAAKDAVCEVSGMLKTVAASYMKIANDIRWLASGPRCGIGEILLPETQPGSSIMPGKVNPVIAESMIMASAQVLGNDVTITLCSATGNFELNVMMPVMAHDLLESVHILASSATNFADKCVDGIQADKDRCNDMIEKSLAMCTSLTVEIGYDKAAAVAKKAYKSGKTVREVAMEEGEISEERLSELLDPLTMAKPKK
jgi:fumarate hydratase class II